VKLNLCARSLSAGKTILASVIIEDCLRDKSFTTSFFYCKHGDPEKNNCHSILKGLLSQLLCQCRDLVPFCHDRYLASGELTLTSASLAEQLLDLFCQRIPKQYIIVDGLDECTMGERKLVLSFFNTMIGRYDMKEPGKIRILFVSQDEDDIKDALQTAAVIALGPTDNENDIRSFVRRSTMKIQQKHGLDNHQAEYIIESTCARTKGTSRQTLPSTVLTMTRRYVPIRKVGHVEPLCAAHTSAAPGRDQSKQISAGTGTSVSPC
jgi:hypothetical protein